MPKKKHSVTKTISAEMDGYDIGWISSIGDLSDYAHFALFYKMVAYGRMEGRLKPPKHLYKQFASKAESDDPTVKAGMYGLLESLKVAILRGDIKAVRALADIMEQIENGDIPVSPIHHALKYFHFLEGEGDESFRDLPNFVDSPGVKEAREWRARLPLTVSGYRAFVLQETGVEYSLPAIRAALKQLRIPIKKDAPGVKGAPGNSIFCKKVMISAL